MSKDYIDRQALIDDLIHNRSFYPVAVKNAIKAAPAADVVEVVHGAWIEEKYPFCNVCPHCGVVIDRTCIKMQSGALNYCPNCSAKMDGGTHEN